MELCTAGLPKTRFSEALRLLGLGLLSFAYRMNGSAEYWNRHRLAGIFRIAMPTFSA